MIPILFHAMFISPSFPELKFWTSSWVFVLQGISNERTLISIQCDFTFERAELEKQFLFSYYHENEHDKNKAKHQI